MTKFTLTIDCDGTAFSDDGEPGQGVLPEVGRILESLAKRLVREGVSSEGRLWDGNSRTVGVWKLED